MRRYVFGILSFCAGTTLALMIQPAAAQPFVVNFNVTSGSGDWNNENNWADLIVPEAIADEIARIASGGTAQVMTSVPDVVGLQVNTGAVEILNNGSLQVVPGTGGTRGTTQIAGAGRLSIASGGSFNSHDLAAFGTLSLAAGGGLNVNKSLALQGTMQVEQIDNAYQTISVSETASLGGTLNLTFPAAPSLSVGDSWNLIDAGEIIGNFDTVATDHSAAYTVFGTTVAAGGSNGKLLRLTYEQVLALSVDRSTGAVTLRNVSGGSPVETDGYSIRSSLGALDPNAFDSLGDQSVGGFVTGASTNHVFVELQPGGSSIIAGGTSYELGNVYQPPAPTQFQESTEDLVFEHTRPDGLVLRGVVEYEGFGINDLVLQVDPNTGAGTLVNESPFTIHIDGYAISSESGQLLTNWTGLGGDWVKSASSTANELTELNPLSSATLSPGTRLDLGSIVNVGAAGGVGLPDADLQLEFLLADAATEGGDYNEDGVVDAADYTVWRDNLGAAAGTLPNDPNDGVIGAAQYATWKSAFGGSGGSSVPGEVDFRSGTVVYEMRFPSLVASTSAVPEPSGLLLLSGVSVSILLITKRGRNVFMRNAVRMGPSLPRTGMSKYGPVLAVALALLLPFATARADLLVYSGFDYAQSDLGSASSTNDIGFAGPWNIDTSVDLDSSSSLPYPEGVTLSQLSGKLADTAGGTNTRPIAANAQLDFDADQDYYFSFLYQQNAARFAVLDFLADTRQVIEVGTGSDRRFRYFFNNSTNLNFGDVSEVEETYFFVGKIEASSSGFDPAYLQVYKVGHDKVGSEPATWDFHVPDVSLTGVVDSVAVRSGVGGTTADWAFDELRIGTTWDDVAANSFVPGDANGDGQLNSGDFDTILAHMHQSVGSGTNGDINFDRVVDFDDFRLWKNIAGASLVAATIPEPSSILLAAIMGCIVLSMRYLRN